MFSDTSRFLAMLGLSACVITGCGGSDSGTHPVQSTDETHETDKVVNLYFWSDYLAPDTLATFEKVTGVKVHLSYFDSYEMLEGRILAGHSGFDVVLPGSGILGREIKSRAYLPLDKSRLSNIINLDPAIMSKVSVSDPGNAYGVVYMWSTYGIGFNKKMIAGRLSNASLTSWRSVFDPVSASKLAPCGINFIDDPGAVVQILLKYLGRDPSAPARRILPT